MKLDDAAAAASAASASEPEVVYEASSLRWGSLKRIGEKRIFITKLA